MSGTLALASSIALMDREALTALVSARPTQAATGVTDPIGLATELLRPESISRALAPLDRESLAALSNPASLASSPRVSSLTELGLIGITNDTPVALPEVCDSLEAGLEDAGVSKLELTATSFRTTIRDPEPQTGTWYTAALTAVGQAAEILRTLKDRPGRLNRSGSIAVATLRGIAEATSIEVSHVSFALHAVRQSELVSLSKSSQLLSLTPRAAAWLALPYDERWLALAGDTLRTMPHPLHVSLAHAQGDLTAAVEGIAERFPLLPTATHKATADFAAAAEHLGLTVEGVLSPPARHLVDEALDAAHAAALRDMPSVATGVYVQPDLSVVIPGPLGPADEADIAALSKPEHIGVASTRRITEASLAEAFEHGNLRVEFDPDGTHVGATAASKNHSNGLTADSARAIFARLSSTGIPQPLEYLLASLADRIGSIVVREHLGDEGRTRVTVSRPELSDTLMVDRALQHVQFVPADPAPGSFALYSRLRPDHVLAALTDARYPATADSDYASEAATAPKAFPLSSGGILNADKPAEPIAAAASSPQHAPRTTLNADQIALVERVYLAARSEPGASDFTRRLELAIRDRSTVKVTAEARGQVYTFLLAPVSLSGGRLRATDEVAGMERTLPVSMITAIDGP